MLVHNKRIYHKILSQKETMKYRNHKTGLPTRKEINRCFSIAASFFGIIGITFVLFLIFITKGVFY